MLPICFSSNVYADAQEQQLIKKSKESGNMIVVTSTKTDPIGIAGLWGLKGHFIAHHNCIQSFAGLSDVEKYPLHSKTVRRVTVREKTENTLLVNYTEGYFGMESTSQQYWTFDSTASIPTITSISVGKKDPPSWVELQFHDAGHPDFCDIHVRVFADMSYIPKFVLKWMSDTAAKELTKNYRDIIKGSVTD